MCTLNLIMVAANRFVISALSDIIAKWQHLGTTTSQQQSGRPRKGTKAL